MTSEPRQPRCIHFIDARLQASLIGLLVLTEVVLAAICVWQLDVQLNALLDAQLYRVHYREPPGYEAMQRVALVVLTAFAAGNLVLLFAVEMCWAAYVQRQLRSFRALVERAAALDYRVVTPSDASHPVAALAAQWRDAERRRLHEIRQLLEQLIAVPHSVEIRREILGALSAQLPHGKVSRPAP